MRSYFAPVPPVAKPRQTQRDKWQQRAPVLAYRNFADSLRLWAAAVRFTLPMEGARVTFWLPVPASWSSAKQLAMEGEPHQSKPDLDNLLKALLDALAPADQRVSSIQVSKRWARTPGITLVVP